MAETTIEKIKDLSEFHLFASLVPRFEWLTEETADQLDEEYFLGRSGNKTISPYLENLIERYGEEDAMPKAYKSVEIRFADKWRRLYEAFNAEYNPINNYDMTEEENIGSKKVTSSEKENTVEASSQDSSETSGETSQSTSGESTDYKSGFNSPSPVATGKTETSGSGSGSSSSSTSGSSSSSSTESGSGTITEEGKFDENKRKLTRSGNIGVTTSQQMIQSEIDLRSWNYFESLFKDVDSVLTCSLYS